MYEETTKQMRGVVQAPSSSLYLSGIIHLLVRKKRSTQLDIRCVTSVCNLQVIRGGSYDPILLHFFNFPFN